jgi:hypothetical protein
VSSNVRVPHGVLVRPSVGVRRQSLGERRPNLKKQRPSLGEQPSVRGREQRVGERRRWSRSVTAGSTATAPRLSLGTISIPTAIAQ